MVFYTMVKIVREKADGSTFTIRKICFFGSWIHLSPMNQFFKIPLMPKNRMRMFAGSNGSAKAFCLINLT